MMRQHNRDHIERFLRTSAAHLLRGAAETEGDLSDDYRERAGALEQLADEVRAGRSPAAGDADAHERGG